jgi:hypothetical protein
MVTPVPPGGGGTPPGGPDPGWGVHSNRWDGGMAIQCLP